MCHGLDKYSPLLIFFPLRFSNVTTLKDKKPYELAKSYAVEAGGGVIWSSKTKIVCEETQQWSSPWEHQAQSEARWWEHHAERYL